MDSENRLQAFIAFCICSALVIAIFMVGSCVNRESKMDNEIKIVCLQKGGNWELVPGTSGTFGCRMKP